LQGLVSQTLIKAVANMVAEDLTLTITLIDTLFMTLDQTRTGQLHC